jgi:hypothetical protein
MTVIQVTGAVLDRIQSVPRLVLRYLLQRRLGTLQVPLEVNSAQLEQFPFYLQD